MSHDSQATLATAALDELVDAALAEDLGDGDVTGEATIPADARARGCLLAKEAGVLAGLDVFSRTFERLDSSVRFERLASDGDSVQIGAVVCVLEGGARALLAGERTALNFVQRLSGIATLTRAFVERADGRARILDTRKTTPGLRALEKRAVLAGGGENHRFGLFDEAMIKDNHLDVSGQGPRALVEALRARHGDELVITAEARTDEDALAAAAAGADVVLLDNRTPDGLATLVPRVRAAACASGLELEVSGNVTLDNVAAYAASGVDRISIGALTHSAPSLDLSLALEVLP